MEVVLICSTADGSEEVKLSDNNQVSFGRGGEADFRFNDDGLSRLHSTIYREGSNIWIVDENSTNGTFVNGEQVRSGGTPLNDGDRIKIGNYTDIKVKFVQAEKSQTAAVGNTTQTVSASQSNSTVSLASLLPIAIISIGFFVIAVSALFIGYTVINRNKEPEIVKTTPTDEEEDFDTPEDNKSGGTTTPTATPKSGTPPPTNSSGNNNVNLTNSPESPKNSQNVALPSGKRYLSLSEPERTEYVKAKLRKTAQIIGNRSTEDIPDSAVNRIKTDVTGYANRINTSKSAGAKCKSSKLGDDLQTTYERARNAAPYIIQAFSQEGIDPQVGLYIAMIESEYCPCVQSGTGPLGMFQFAYAAATENFPSNAKIVKGANPSNPDDRCTPEIAAKGSAKYVKYLMTWFGTGPASVPLSIASYNSGQGAMRKNLLTALKSDPSLNRDFWTLIANSDKLSQQFRDENFKYPPKFFAAAIIGENPQDFGLDMQPISTYTK